MYKPELKVDNKPLVGDESNGQLIGRLMAKGLKKAILGDEAADKLERGKSVLIIGGGPSMDMAMYLATGNAKQRKIIIEGNPDRDGKLLSEVLRPDSLPLKPNPPLDITPEWKRFRQGSNITPKKKKRKK